jgi:hypothetical protein
LSDRRRSAARAIIDVCDELVLALAPASLWPDIRAAIESDGKTLEPNRAPVSAVSRQEPEDSPHPGEEPVFSGLSGPISLTEIRRPVILQFRHIGYIDR